MSDSTSSSKSSTGKSAGKKSPSGPPFQGYLNHNLSAMDKENLSAMDLHSEFPESAIFDLAHEGYKFSIRRDDKNNCFMASLLDADEASPNAGWCLVGRGANAVDAWHALAYRHFVVFSDGWVIGSTNSSQWS